MGNSLFIGIAGAITFILLAGRSIGWKNVAKHAIKVDLVVSFLCFGFFAKASTDAVVGSVVAALLVTIFTWLFRTYWKWAAERGYLSPLDADSDAWTKAQDIAQNALKKAEAMLAD